MPKGRSEEESLETWKNEMDESIKRLSGSLETGLRAITEEMRTLEYQVQAIIDGFGKIEYMLQQQAQQLKQEEPSHKGKAGKIDTNIDEFKQIATTLSKLVKTIDETMDGRFLEIKNLINDVELNILSMQKKLILESKIKSRDKEV
jgi:chromosome segregation ATPase